MSSSTSLAASAYPGTLHFIPPKLSAFEPSKPLVRSTNINTLIWIGGLSDTPLSVTYPLVLTQALGPTWSLVTANLSSSGLSWGVSSIARDADELAKIVAHFKSIRPGGRVVLMGHSTGCQDCMQYLLGSTHEKRPDIDGIILQAPVSDREALGLVLPEAHLSEANQLALEMCRNGKQKDALPNRLTKPIFDQVAITAQRWVDLASPGPHHTGAEDFFSSDFTDERLASTFGKLPSDVLLLILYGGSDEYVPSSLDKQGLVQRWIGAVKSGKGTVDEANSGVVDGATHNLNGDPEHVINDLVQRVIRYTQHLSNSSS